jgi:hypothetical protein
MRTLASEIEDMQTEWRPLSVYRRFEQTARSVLTLVIAAVIEIATWQSLLDAISLIGSHVLISLIRNYPRIGTSIRAQHGGMMAFLSIPEELGED